VLKVREAIQGFRVKIIDLEVGTKPSTPLEEREQRHKTSMIIVESIKSLEEEYAKFH
jgi:hypothetical protein